MPGDRAMSGPEPIPADAVVRLPRSLLQPAAPQRRAEAPVADPAPAAAVPPAEPDLPHATPAAAETDGRKDRRDDNVTHLEQRRRPPYFGRRDWTSLAIGAIAVIGVGVLVARLHASGWSGFAEMFARP